MDYSKSKVIVVPSCSLLLHHSWASSFLRSYWCQRKASSKNTLTKYLALLMLNYLASFNYLAYQVMLWLRIEKQIGTKGYRISRKESLDLRSSVLNADFFEKVIILPMEESFVHHPLYHYHRESGPPVLNVGVSGVKCWNLRSVNQAVGTSLDTWHHFTMLAWRKPGHWAASGDDHERDFCQESSESSKEHCKLWSTFAFPFGE